MRILLILILGIGCIKQGQTVVDIREVSKTQQTITITAAMLSNYALSNYGRFPSTERGLKAIPGVLPDAFVDAWEQPLVYVAPALNCDAPFELISGGYDRKLGGKGDISSCRLPSPDFPG